MKWLAGASIAIGVLALAWATMPYGLVLLVGLVWLAARS